MRKKDLRNPSLKVAVKLAILHTIANTIYPSTARKIREAVANAMDNKATWFIISADRETNTLSLFDNGNGITRDRFREIFTNLGFGLLKGGPEDKLSYFGLGLISIFRLGKKARIFTKPQQEKYTLCLDVDTEKIFDPDNEKKPIDFLKQCIKLRNDGLAKRLATPAPSIEQHIRTLLGTKPNSYTEIVIEEVYPEDFEQITGANFEIELRQLLPLAPDDKDPFLLRIKDPRKLGHLKKIFEDKKYFPTIDVYLSIAEEKPLTKLRKYFPEFKEELEYKEADIEVGTSPSKEFKYYIIHTTQDLERSEKVGSETGFWVRNQNFLVKAADFFEKAGSKKKHVHEPLKNWMYGEIFHRNMNEFLTVVRNDYIWESQKFLDFMDEAIEIVYDLNRKLRTVWKQKQRVVAAIVKPFELLGDPKGPMYRCNDTLEKMGIRADGREAEIIIDKLHKRRRPELEDDKKRVDYIFKKKVGKPITLADKEEVTVQIDPNVPQGEFYQDIWDPDNQKTIISISPNLFNPKEVIFLGKTFMVYFVIAKETESAISVNKDRAAIYINPFNTDLKSYTVSFIDIYIAIEIAYVMTSTKEEMKNYLLKLLGRDFPSVVEYFGPLADDLMRKLQTK
jgi:hypothetical protein